MLNKFSLQKKLFLVLAAVSFFSVVYLSFKTGFSPLPSATPSVTPLPAKINPPPNSQLEDIQISSIIIPPSFILPSMPESLPVYQVKSVVPDYTTLASGLARYFQLSPSSSSKTSWSNPDGSRHLGINYQNQTVSYLFTPQTSTSSKQLLARPNLESSTKVASTFIKNFPVWKNYSIQPDQISYLQSGSGEYVATSPEKADTVRLSYTELLDGYPLRFTNQNSAPLTIYIGPGNVITKLVFSPSPISVSPSSETKNTTPEENITQYLKVGQVQILDAFRGSFYKDINGPIVITVKSVNIEYHYLPSKEIIAPYYVFEGSFQLPSALSYDTAGQPIFFLLPVVDL
jgi:hypothetical protein